MTSPFLGPYTVSAYNTAHDSENKIHDDAVARRFGFGGGLVPGVDVYGYMTHLPVMRWGRAWLDSDNDPWVDMTVNLKGGITAANLDDTASWWWSVLRDFEDHIGFTP